MIGRWRLRIWSGGGNRWGRKGEEKRWLAGAAVESTTGKLHRGEAVAADGVSRSSPLLPLQSLRSTVVACRYIDQLRRRRRPHLFHWLPGDLIYLNVVTLVGNIYSITGTTKNFYVNSSTANVLDTRPGKTSSEATTVIGLLQKISSKFKKSIKDMFRSRHCLFGF
nr:clustered mitochondria protein [Ipomoea batatas]